MSLCVGGLLRLQGRLNYRSGLLFSLFAIHTRSYQLYSSKNPYKLSFTPVEIYLLNTKNDLLHHEDEVKVLNLKESEENTANINFESSSPCTPIHLQILARHGSRYPGKSDTDNAKILLNKIQGKVQALHFRELNQWTLPYSNEQIMELAQLGVEEQMSIGYRYAEKFGEFLKNCSYNEYEFQSSSRVRTVDSGFAFKSGLEQYLGIKIPLQIKRADNFMRFFDNCHQYKQSLEQQKSDQYNNFELFKTSSLMKQTSQNVLNKLGIPLDSMVLSAGMCIAYLLCFFGILKQ